MEKLNPEHKLVLERIQESIPKEWIENATVREDLAPTIKEVLQKALEDKDVSPETKAEAQMVLNSGVLNKQVDVEQKDVAELIDAYVEMEMIKAVMLKRLPPFKKKRSYEVALKRFNKLKQKYDNK